MERAFLIFCVYLVEGIIAWQYFNALFERKRSLWICVIVTIMGYAAAWAFFDMNLIWLNLVLLSLFNFLILLICFQCSWKDAVFHSGMLTAVIFLSEVIVELILGVIFGGFGQYQSNIIVFFALFVFSKLLLFGTSKLCIRIVNKGRGRIQSQGPAVLFFSSSSVVTVAILLIMSYTALTAPLPDYIETMMVGGTVLLFFANLLIYTGYQHDRQLSQENFSLLLAQQKDEAEERYYQALEEQYDHQRIFIHDIKRHLTVIREMAEENADSAVGEYTEKLIESPALQRKVHYCSNPMLNIVLSRYAELCEEKGIAFFPDVRNVSLDFLSPGDITSLFSNLLENAVEAAEGAENPTIELRMYSSRGRAFFFSLVNSCSQPPQADTDGGYVSHKSDQSKHGVGLKSVRNTVKKYHGTLRQSYDSEKNQFHTVILI